MPTPTAAPHLTLDIEHKGTTTVVSCRQIRLRRYGRTFLKGPPADPRLLNTSSSTSAISRTWTAWASAPSCAFMSPPAPQAVLSNSSTSASVFADCFELTNIWAVFGTVGERGIRF